MVDSGQPAQKPENHGRRRFINWFLGTSAGGLVSLILYPVLRFMSPPDVPEATTNQVDAGLTNDPDLAASGFKIVRFGSEPVILIRVSGGEEFRAFSATCTHLDCVVEFHEDHQRIWCNCHNGEYDLHGINVGGPPPRPLQPYNVNLVSNGSGRPASIVISKA